MMKTIELLIGDVKIIGTMQSLTFESLYFRNKLRDNFFNVIDLKDSKFTFNELYPLIKTIENVHKTRNNNNILIKSCICNTNQELCLIHSGCVNINNIKNMIDYFQAIKVYHYILDDLIAGLDNHELNTKNGFYNFIVNNYHYFFDNDNELKLVNRCNGIKSGINFMSNEMSNHIIEILLREFSKLKYLTVKQFEIYSKLFNIGMERFCHLENTTIDLENIKIEGVSFDLEKLKKKLIDNSLMCIDGWYALDLLIEHKAPLKIISNISANIIDSKCFKNDNMTYYPEKNLLVLNKANIENNKLSVNVNRDLLICPFDIIITTSNASVGNIYQLYCIVNKLNSGIAKVGHLNSKSNIEHIFNTNKNNINSVIYCDDNASIFNNMLAIRGFNSNVKYEQYDLNVKNNKESYYYIMNYDRIDIVIGDVTVGKLF